MTNKTSSYFRFHIAIRKNWVISCAFNSITTHMWEFSWCNSNFDGVQFAFFFVEIYLQHSFYSLIQVFYFRENWEEFLPNLEWLWGIFFFNCFQKYSSKYSYDNHIRINFIVTNQVSLKSYIKTDTFLSRFSNLHHLSFLYPSILLERVLTRRNVSKKPPSRWQVPNSKEKLMRNNCKLFKQNKLNSYSRQWQTFE